MEKKYISLVKSFKPLLDCIRIFNESVEYRIRIHSIKRKPVCETRCIYKFIIDRLSEHNWHLDDTVIDISYNSNFLVIHNNSDLLGLVSIRLRQCSRSVVIFEKSNSQHFVSNSTVFLKEHSLKTILKRKTFLILPDFGTTVKRLSLIHI